jgi:membrane-associated phospholipid phosphatase
MNKIKEIIYNLKAFDLVLVVFFIFLCTLDIIYHNVIPRWSEFIIENILIISSAFIIAWLETTFKHRIWRILHYWYIAPIILITFNQLYYMVWPIRHQDYDTLFIQIDRFIFGTDPTMVLYKIANPYLTELLQVIYGMYYLLPLILALVLLRKRRYFACDFAVFSVIYGFYLSYLGYFALPGIGPRFTLHNFANINAELPGIWLTKYLRDFTNVGEAIPNGTINPAAVVQRDVFPSGHTMITLIVIYLSIRLKSRSRYWLVPLGSLLIFATVYLRYHYVIDLIGGFLFAAFSLWSGKIIFNWWRRIRGFAEFEYGRYSSDEWEKAAS